MEISGLVELATTAALERKAEKIVVQDLRGLSDVCSTQIICSGSNERQVKAISDAIEYKVKSTTGEFPLAVEGKDSGQWIVIDYGHSLIHVFTTEIRQYYGIESLWPSAPSKLVSDTIAEESNSQN